jgi:hypothetical protein
MPKPPALLLELCPPDDEGPLMKAVCEDLRTAIIRAARTIEAERRTDHDETERQRPPGWKPQRPPGWDFDFDYDYGL